MVSRAAPMPIVQWLTFAIALVTQTALVAAFVYGLHIRLMMMEAQLLESRADRATLHTEAATIPLLKLQIEQIVKDLQETQQILSTHAKETGGISR
jgi:capsule polysaccharide export protein KpsE/RkpR